MRKRHFYALLFLLAIVVKSDPAFAGVLDVLHGQWDIDVQGTIASNPDMQLMLLGVPANNKALVMQEIEHKLHRIAIHFNSEKQICSLRLADGHIKQYKYSVINSGGNSVTLVIDGVGNKFTLLSRDHLLAEGMMGKLILIRHKNN